MQLRLFSAVPVLLWSTSSVAATPALLANAADQLPSPNAWPQAEAAEASGRSAEAADLYEQAASTTTDDGLRALALLSAASAALDAGQPRRARDLLEAARRSPQAANIHDLIASLDEQLTAEENGRWMPAPSSAPPTPVLASPASETSRPLGLSSRATAADTPPARGAAVLDGFVLTSVGSGYDSNVSMSAAAAADGDAAVKASDGDWFATALLMVDVAHRWNRAGSSELTYSFFQVAYPQAAHDSYSLQDHLVELAHRWSLSTSVRTFVSGRAGATFSGLRGGLAAFLRTVGLDAGVMVDESPRARLRAMAGVTGRQVLDPGYSYLTGTRWDVAMDQEWRPASWLLAGGLSYRQELVGQLRDALDAAPPGQAGIPCAGCALDAVTPYSHRVVGVGLRGRSPAGHRLRAGARLRVEDRLYSPASLEALPAGGAATGFSFRRRRDRRFSGGVEVSLGRESELSLRYDVTVNRSHVEGADASLCREVLICHPLDAENHDYVRHVVTLGVDYGVWFL
jgi:hypothetical protein